MEPIGEYLKREREFRNISLEEIADATKIHIGLLRAIEEGQKDLLPAEVFVRGFIRCYAEYIGLDPNDVLLRYPEQAKGLKSSEDIRPPAEKKIWPFSPKHGKYIWASILIIILILILGLIVYIGQRPSPKSSPKPKTLKKEQHTAIGTAPETNHIVDQTEADANSKTDLSSPQTKASVASKQGFDKAQYVLRAIFKEKTWVQALIDGQILQEYSFKPGETFTWTINDKIRLLIDNAGGVELYLNDRPLKPLGNSGQVVSITLPNPALM